MNEEKITTAVVTGEHPFDVPNFYRLFRSFPDVDFYIQHMDQAFVPFSFYHLIGEVPDSGKATDQYDVVIFYNWHLETPPAHERGWWQEGSTGVLEHLGETKQGIVFLHHAIVAFPQWEFWSELMGNSHQDRAWSFEDPQTVKDSLSSGETMHIEIADPDHPIVSGLDEWDVQGETWGYFGGFPGPDCRVLLTTEHPKMRMKAMAWTYHFKKARVFCFQPGHDNNSWSNETFRTILHRGIRWAADKI
jgi:hypothetical protein